MSIGDTGGFDVAVEVTEDLLSAAFTGGPSLPVPPDSEADLGDFRFRVSVATVDLTGLDLHPGEVVFLRGRLTGTATLLSASVAGGSINLPPGLSDAVVTGTFAIRATVAVGVNNGTRGIVLTPAAAGSTVMLDENAFFASPPVQLLLAAAYIQAGGGAAGEAAYQQRRMLISAALRGSATDAIVAAAAATPAAVLVAEPAGLTFAAVRTTSLALKVLASVLLPPGDPALASATTLRRDAVGGPVEHVGLVVNNGSILSTVRLTLSAALGISSGFGPWFAAHPSLVLRPVPIAPPAVPIPSLPPIPGNPPAATPFLDFAHAFVNGAGQLQVDVRVRAVMWASLATVTSTATAIAPFTTTITGGVLTFGLGAPIVTTTSDVVINPWFYVAAVFLGAPVVGAILSTVDLFAGPFIDRAIRGPLATALGGLGVGLTLPLSGPFVALTPLATSGVEPGAPARFVTIPGPVPVTVPIDLAQDVTSRLA